MSRSPKAPWEARQAGIGRLRPRSFGLAAGLLLASSMAGHAANCGASAQPSVDWSGCDRNNLMLTGAALDAAMLTETDLSLSDLGGASLAKADLTDAKLVRSSLKEAQADGGNFSKIEAYRTNFSGMSAREALFRGAELQRANFSEAMLAGAKFEKAELGRANFTQAYLGANSFAYANLARATFKDAEIEGPLDFANAYMLLTRIEGVDLSKAANLKQEQVNLACGDADTRLPEGLAAPANWPCKASE